MVSRLALTQESIGSTPIASANYRRIFRLKAGVS